MFQMKERDKTPEEGLRKVEINNLPDNEFKIRIIKKLNKLGRKVHEYSDKFNKDLGNIKKNQRASQVALVVKNPLVMQETKETWVRPLDWEDPLEEDMATHSSILSWRIPWTAEPGKLQSRGLKELDRLK